MKDHHSRDFENSHNDVQILQDRLLKELCSRDYHSKRLGKLPVFDINDIYKKSFKDVEKQYFLKFLNWFAQESGYVQFLYENTIAITFLGRNYCIISKQYR
jgi:hypothetical protein